jgi:hypothetical protein
VIVCPRCKTVLRKIPGLHQEGEPYFCMDERGSYMICLSCATRVAWRDESAGDHIALGASPLHDLSVTGHRAPLDCPFCGSRKIEVICVDYDNSPALAASCGECGAVGPPSHGDDSMQAVARWNLRFGRLTGVE